MTVEESNDSISFSTTNSTRRRLLKAVALGGGVVGLSVLPSRWARPEIGIGTLPVHAAASTDGLCCSQVSSTAGGDNSLLLFEGKIQGEIRVCFPDCDGADMRLLQDSTVLSADDAGCSASGPPGGTFDCGSTICALFGGGLAADESGSGNLFSGSEVLSPGPATFRVVWAGGECDLAITLVEVEP